ncbi:MAG: Serine-pyruvate aminotransferase [Anaerolineales bacterium]|nr:Serine-pyruvate aminotransferase [Anaerolineales bacterium]
MFNIPDDLNLRIPGPTPLPAEVREALAQPMMSHRSRTFGAIHAEVAEGLREMLRTTNDVFVLTASGTGAMEAAVVNTLSPGDSVLSAAGGKFGERFRTIASAYGADIVPLDHTWGTAAAPDDIGAALDEHPDVRAVLVTHNETSTGVTNPLRDIASVVKANNTPPLLIVDAISSAGCIELEVDAWNIDVLVTGSQKGWMIPPGLAYIAFSDAAWAAHAQATMPRFYFDLTAAKKKLLANQTPWTPAVNLFYGLTAALRLMRQEGVDNIWSRHQRVADHTRQRVQEMELELFATPQYASNTVTAVQAPADLDVAELRRRLAEKHRVILSGGHGPLKGKIFRIGHLGNVSEPAIDAALAAVAEELAER